MIPPEPGFAEPWQARLWGLTQELATAGLFDWPTWTPAFGAALARQSGSEPEGGDYHTVWLATLETLLADRGIAPGEVDAMTEAWAQAYLTTPHGAPVRLAKI